MACCRSPAVAWRQNTCESMTRRSARWKYPFPSITLLSEGFTCRGGGILNTIGREGERAGGGGYVPAGREPGAVQVTSVQVRNLLLSHSYGCTLGPRPISHQPTKVHLISTTGPITRLRANETVWWGLRPFRQWFYMQKNLKNALVFQIVAI